VFLIDSDTDKRSQGYVMHVRDCHVFAYFIPRISCLVLDLDSPPSMGILSFHDCLLDAIFFFLLSFGASQEAIFVIVKAGFVPFLFFPCFLLELVKKLFFHFIV
jgi:hypothetical protein